MNDKSIVMIEFIEKMMHNVVKIIQHVQQNRCVFAQNVSMVLDVNFLRFHFRERKRTELTSKKQGRTEPNSNCFSKNEVEPNRTRTAFSKINSNRTEPELYF
jgi:hypothetical protein